MPKGKSPSREPKKKSNYYKGGKCIKTPCPKCGAGVFMAEHKDRKHCGCCGYTIWTKKKE